MPTDSVDSQKHPTRYGLAAALIVACIVRLAGWAYWQPGPTGGIVSGYIQPVCTLSSGYGFLAATHAASEGNYGFDAPTSMMAFMREREQAGGRVDAEHPFPRTTEGFIPRTIHPPGYSILLYLMYCIGNFSGMGWLTTALSVALDVVACGLVYLFARNIFDRRVAIVAAWIYALLPPAIMTSLLFMPDAFHGFFISSILCLASYATARRGWMLIPAGAAVGFACLFRSEYLLLPGAVYVVMLFWRRRFWSTTGWSIGMGAATLLVLSPWAWWTHQAVGKAMLGSTAGGRTMYQALGEDTQNPWGIVAADLWSDADALKLGFSSPVSPEANAYYGAEFKRYVRTYPLRYAKTILVHRLPLALVPPHLTPVVRASSDAFSFGYYMRTEGLSRWAVIRKYPVKVLRYLWLPISMAGLSLVLLIALFVACLLNRRALGRAMWLLLPWAYTVGSMCVVKQIEPRNVAPVLVVQTVALAFVLVYWRDRRTRRVAAT
ncbi:MAG: glycosyltransferase family 39 protein [Phycisphaerales bacterium]|nr:glycosyltransferase family 39 protein [Phycisphaerales bacterium]